MPDPLILGDLVVRPVTDDEFDEFDRVEAACFGGFPTETGTAVERSLTDLDRTVAAFADGDLVGTTSAYAFDLTVPGGATLPVAGVTSVGVLPTHRRRGVLRAMMAFQLDDVARRGEPMAILNASESSIYGRFGYGLASEYQTVELDRHGASFEVPVAERRLRMLDRTEAGQVLPSIYDTYRAIRPGSVSRSAAWWSAMLGEHQSWKGGGQIFVVVAEGGTEAERGYVIYDLDRVGLGISQRLSIRELLSVDDDTDAALWRYCSQVDLVATVVATARPADDPLRWRLADPRQLRVTSQRDYLWVRLLDVATSLEARRYPVDGDLVVDVDDVARPDVGGRFELVVEGGVGRCRRTERAAHLRLGIADLGSLYLGGVGARSLARAGRIAEVESGAVGRADAMFGWPLQPYCTTTF
jgi:predicted acetyltransferase